MSEPTTDPRALTFDLESARAQLEYELPDALKNRTSELFDKIVERHGHGQGKLINEIYVGVAERNGFASREELEREIDLFLSIRASEASGAYVAITPAVQQLLERVQQAMSDLEKVLQTANFFQEREFRLLVRHVVQVAELEYRVTRAEQLDPLTGLLRDQSTVSQRFNIERETFIETGNPDEVLMWVEIDLDDFKLLNQAFQPDRVDNEILKPLAEALRTQFRGSDFICRLGGDEFSIVFSNVKKTGIERVLSKVLDVVRAVTLPATDASYAPRKLTASVGSYVIEHPTAKSEQAASTELLYGQVRDRASLAAARSKEHGKDRATVWSTDLEDAVPQLSYFMKRELRDHAITLQDMYTAGDHDAAAELEKILAEAAEVSHRFALKRHKAKLLAK